MGGSYGQLVQNTQRVRRQAIAHAGSHSINLLHRVAEAARTSLIKMVENKLLFEFSARSPLAHPPRLPVLDANSHTIAPVTSVRFSPKHALRRSVG